MTSWWNDWIHLLWLNTKLLKGRCWHKYHHRIIYSRLDVIGNVRKYCVHVLPTVQAALVKSGRHAWNYVHYIKHIEIIWWKLQEIWLCVRNAMKICCRYSIALYLRHQSNEITLCLDCWINIANSAVCSKLWAFFIPRIWAILSHITQLHQLFGRNFGQNSVSAFFG